VLEEFTRTEWTSFCAQWLRNAHLWVPKWTEPYHASGDSARR